MGGALCSLFAAECAARLPEAQLIMYNFGAPKVGDDEFVRRFNRLVPNAFRVVNDADVIVRLPRNKGLGALPGAGNYYHAGRTDKPIAGLLKDLKQRGLLDETLVVWGGEFGRQPTAEYAKGTGRDHNSFGFTMWMAGGGIKGGVSVGTTDELGSKAVENPYHVKNLHATVLTLMGLDPNNLSYFYNGLDQKLVGVEGAEPIYQALA